MLLCYNFFILLQKQKFEFYKTAGACPELPIDFLCTKIRLFFRDAEDVIPYKTTIKFKVKQDTTSSLGGININRQKKLSRDYESGIAN